MAKMNDLYDSIDSPGFADKNLAYSLPTTGCNISTSTTAKELKMKEKPTFRLSCSLVSLAIVISTIALIMATMSISLAQLTQHFEQQTTHQPDCPGSKKQPASSCQQILDCDSSSSNGYYWIAPEDGNATQRYCSMNRVCGGRDGGWMRVAELDMTNSSSQCPSGLRERVHPGQRLCGLDIDRGGCSHVFFQVHIRFSEVCGNIVAFQKGSTDSFGLHPSSLVGTRTIDEGYLDGISLTYSTNPRKHIWSFAAALDEPGTYRIYNCPCTNIAIAAEATPPPDFVGNHYFCDTGSTNPFENSMLYANDPLWDGAGCGPANTCCSLNNPPWFFKQLESSTSEDIEMRVCCNEHRDNEDVRIEQIELYVR